MTLPELRNKIDQINHQLIALLGERLEVAKLIAVYKKNEKLPILDPVREERIKESVKKLAKEHSLSPTIIEEIFTILMDYTRLEMELAR